MEILLADTNRQIYNIFDNVRKGTTTFEEGRAQITALLEALVDKQSVGFDNTYVLFPNDTLFVRISIMYNGDEVCSNKKYYNTFLLQVHPNKQETLVLTCADEFLCSEVKPRGKLPMCGATCVYNIACPQPQPGPYCCPDTIIVCGNDVEIVECPPPKCKRDFILFLNNYLKNNNALYSIRAHEPGAIYVHIATSETLPVFWISEGNRHSAGGFWYGTDANGYNIFLYDGLKHWFSTAPQTEGPFFEIDLTSLLIYAPDEFEAYMAPNIRGNCWIVDLLYASKSKCIAKLYENLREISEPWFIYESCDTIPVYRQSLVAGTCNRMISFAKYNKCLRDYLRPKPCCHPCPLKPCCPPTSCCPPKPICENICEVEECKPERRRKPRSRKPCFDEDSSSGEDEEQKCYKY